MNEYEITLTFGAGDDAEAVRLVEDLTGLLSEFGLVTTRLRRVLPTVSDETLDRGYQQLAQEDSALTTDRGRG